MVARKKPIWIRVKEGHSPIPDNYDIAGSRLESLTNRLKGKPDVLRHYNDVIKEQLEAGVVEKVEYNEQFLNTPGSVFYNPHREVLREDRSTTKLRVVYDARSKRNGEASLNDCQDQGPNLAPLVINILLRFRMKKIALVGDLEKVFPNIIIDPSHRNFLVQGHKCR